MLTWVWRSWKEKSSSLFLQQIIKSKNLCCDGEGFMSPREMDEEVTRG